MNIYGNGQRVPVRRSVVYNVLHVVVAPVSIIHHSIDNENADFFVYTMVRWGIFFDLSCLF